MPFEVSRAQAPAGANEIRTRAKPLCYACGRRGEVLYEDLTDRLFGAPGRWSLKRCPDGDCGLLWLDPVPVEEDIGIAYWEYYTHDGSEEAPPTVWRRWYRGVVAAYLAARFGYDGTASRAGARLLGRALPLHPGRRAEADFGVMYLRACRGGSLLDVGCGGGSFLKRMEGLGWRVEGTDTDPVAVERARELGLTVHPGTLEARRYPDGNFDAVTMSHLVEHVHDPSALLRESWRVLKDGGRLVAVTPNAESWGHRLFGRDWRGLEPPRHLHVFTPRVLRRMAESAGFGHVEVRTTVRDANGMLVASRSLRRVGSFRTDRRPLALPRLWGRGMQLTEWMLLQRKGDIGEEIALVAVK